MLKKTVTYEDFNGDSRTEDLYFNLTRQELLEMEVELGDGKLGLGDTMQKITESDDAKQILALFTEIVKRSYGIRTADGRNFRKSEEAWSDFRSSAAYDELMFNLINNADEGAAFFAGIIPANLKESLDKNQTVQQKVAESYSAHKNVVDAVAPVEPTMLSPLDAAVNSQPPGKNPESMSRAELLEHYKQNAKEFGEA